MTTSNWSARTREIALAQQRRMAARRGGTDGATSSSAPTRGWELPTLGRALRPFPHNLPGVLSYRLLPDRLAKGRAMASSYS
jgi:hypothetical protein